jgi:hypothetical protein
MYDSGHGLKELARRYGVSQLAIHDRVEDGGGHIRPPGRPLRLRSQHAAAPSDAAPPAPGTPQPG